MSKWIANYFKAIKKKCMLKFKNNSKTISKLNLKV